MFLDEIVISGNCPGTYGNDTITTPNYTNSYGNNEDCFWNITARPGRIIVLHFEEFSLESHRSCSYDWLRVYGGKSFRDTNKLCGNTRPSDIESKDNFMYLHFRSDGGIVQKGFKISLKLKCK